MVVVAAAVAIAALVLWWILLTIYRPRYLGDEHFHYLAAVGIAAGQWPAPGQLGMLPTYHALVARVMCATSDSLVSARVTTLLFGIALVIVSAAALRVERSRSGAAAAAVLLLMSVHPLLFPYAALVYTDAPAAACIIAALVIQSRCGGRGTGGWVAAGLLLAATLIRQTSALWALHMVMLAWINQRRAVNLERRDPRLIGLALIPVGVTIAIILTVFMVYRSRVVGSQAANQLEFNQAQLYLLAFSLVVLFFPPIVNCLWRHWTTTLLPMLTSPKWVALLVASPALLAAAFDNPHPWNGDPAFLRNRLLIAMQEHALVRAAICTMICAGGVALAATWRSGEIPVEAMSAGLVGAASVCVHGVADPRYYMVMVSMLAWHGRWAVTLGWGVVLWQAAITVLICGFGLTSTSTYGGIW
jgi:hypothetical protein